MRTESCSSRISANTELCALKQACLKHQVQFMTSSAYVVYNYGLIRDLEHISNLKQHRYIVANSQQYTVWVKIIHFYFTPKIMFHEDILYISYCKYINFKCYFFNNNFFSWCSNSCISAQYCPIITNHTSMESLFINRPLWLVLWSRITFMVQYM